MKENFSYKFFINYLRPNLWPSYPELKSIFLHQSIFLIYQLIVLFISTSIFVFGDQPRSFCVKLELMNIDSRDQSIFEVYSEE